MPTYNSSYLIQILVVFPFFITFIYQYFLYYRQLQYTSSQFPTRHYLFHIYGINGICCCIFKRKVRTDRLTHAYTMLLKQWPIVDLNILHHSFQFVGILCAVQVQNDLFSQSHCHHSQKASHSLMVFKASVHKTGNQVKCLIG